MAPQPPPLDATPFLNDEQQRELGRIPPPFRLLGAWLMVIRDDYLGQWDTRPVPCVECVGQRLPCIEKVGSDDTFRCEGCRLNGYRCGNVHHTVDAEEGRALADRIFSKKRKLESPDPESSPAAVSSIDTKLDLPSNIDDTEMVSSNDRASSSKPRVTCPDPSPFLLPPAGLKSLPPKPMAPLGIAGDWLKLPSNLDHVRSVLDNARRLAQANGRNVNVNVARSVLESDLQRYDCTVLVRPPGTLPTWLVVFVDHVTRRGRVLFNDRQVYGRFQHPAQVCLERAFYIFQKSISMRAEIYPCLEADGDGDLYATALAVHFILNGPGVSGHELVVDKKEAIDQQRMLRAGFWPSSVAVTFGRESKVVARISRHERRLQWVKDDNSSRRGVGERRPRSEA